MKYNIISSIIMVSIVALMKYLDISFKSGALHFVSLLKKQTIQIQSKSNKHKQNKQTDKKKERKKKERK